MPRARRCECPCSAGGRPARHGRGEGAGLSEGGGPDGGGPGDAPEEENGAAGCVLARTVVEVGSGACKHAPNGRLIMTENECPRPLERNTKVRVEARGRLELSHP